MDFPQTQPLPKVSKPKPSKSNTKCSWCDRKRARNDLCNVCRQKVESRARRLMEQKLEGDMDVIQKVMRYFRLNIPSDRMSSVEITNLILESFPYLMLKFQSENTYRGKKGNRCWCLPESVLKKLISPFYPKDTERAAVIAKGGRQELCNLLMLSVAGSFAKYGVTEMKAIDDDADVKMADGHSQSQSMKKENLHIPPPTTSMAAFQRGADRKVDSMSTVSVLGLDPPRKRQRTALDSNRNHNHNEHAGGLMADIQPRHQIWGRSDTNLLSFDVKRCQEFLSKFEQEVLCGSELDKIDPKQHVAFLKQRCQEFVKMLGELRDYVLHLRSSNEMVAAAKEQEVAGLQQRINELLGGNGDREVLMRCTAKLLSKLAPSPVDTQLLRANMDKLEQYHDIACNELTEAIRKFESIGARIGFQRASDQTLIQYVSRILQCLAANRRPLTLHHDDTRSLESLYIRRDAAPSTAHGGNSSTSSSVLDSSSSSAQQLRSMMTSNSSSSSSSTSTSTSNRGLPPQCNPTTIGISIHSPSNNASAPVTISRVPSFPIGSGSAPLFGAQLNGVNGINAQRMQPLTVNPVQCGQAQGQKQFVIPQFVNALPPGVATMPNQQAPRLQAPRQTMGQQPQSATMTRSLSQLQPQGPHQQQQQQGHQLGHQQGHQQGHHQGQQQGQKQIANTFSQLSRQACPLPLQPPASAV